MKKSHTLALAFIIALSSCTNKASFDNLAQFENKAPSKLLEDPVIGKAIRKIVPSDMMSCLNETFDYMPDLYKMNDGSIGQRQEGSHVDNWRYSFLRVSLDGDIDILHTCENPDNTSTYIMHTNRGLDAPPPTELKEYLDGLNSTLGKPIQQIIMTDGQNNLKIASATLASRTKSESKSLDNQKTIATAFSEIVCDLEGIKTGYYDRSFPASLKNLDTDSVCNAIDAVHKKLEKTSAETLDSICEPVDEYAKEKGGHNETYNWLSGFESDPQSQKMMKMLKLCDPNNRKNSSKELVADVQLNMYSAGMIKEGLFIKSKCPAILIEMASESGKNRGYVLQGLNGCENLSTYNNSKPYPGNEIISKYSYDGEIPNDFVKNGEIKPFYRKNQSETSFKETEESKSEPSSQTKEITSSAPTGGIGQRYANAAADQLERASHPACQAQAAVLRSLANSGNPDFVITAQVDAIIGHLPDICAY